MVDKFIPTGDVRKDIIDLSARFNEFVDKIQVGGSSRSATEDGIRISRTENKGAILEAVVDGAKYQTLLSVMSKGGRNKETSPRIVPRTKYIDSSSDAVDVTNISVLFVYAFSASVNIGGFVGGTDGQVLFVVALVEASETGLERVVLENDEGTGNQDIQTSTDADIPLYGGGATLVYRKATNLWYEIGYSA